MPRKRSARTIAVIGNGIIGHGIAEIFAMAGWQVRLIGRSAASLAAALGRIAASMASFEAHGLASAVQSKAALAHIATTLLLDDAAAAIPQTVIVLHKLAQICQDKNRRPTPRRDRIGRNAPCPCGSGQKYKRCCGAS